jgi:F-type H+-transporting ATPase subunit epsilon
MVVTMLRLHLEVLTPEATVFDAEVDAVVVPLADGWLGVLPGHASFQARLMRGEALMRVGGQTRLLAILGGTILVHEGTVTILTGRAGLDQNLEALEQEISGQLQRVAALEKEAEKHFDRIYRQMAHTFQHRGRRHA